MKEFLADGVKAAGITSARAVIPTGPLVSQIRDAIQRARDNALMQDPMLKQAIQNEKNSKAKQKLEAMIPSLSDQVIRGDFSLGNLPAQLRNILHDTIGTTDLERTQPTKNTKPSGTGKKP